MNWNYWYYDCSYTNTKIKLHFITDNINTNAKVLPVVVPIKQNKHFHNSGKPEQKVSLDISLLVLVIHL